MVGDDEDELESDDSVQGHYCLQYKRSRTRLWIILGIQPYSDSIRAMLIEKNKMGIIDNDIRIKQE